MENLTINLQTMEGYDLQSLNILDEQNTMFCSHLLDSLKPNLQDNNICLINSDKIHLEDSSCFLFN